MLGMTESSLISRLAASVFCAPWNIGFLGGKGFARAGSTSTNVNSVWEGISTAVFFGTSGTMALDNHCIQRGMAMLRHQPSATPNRQVEKSSTCSRREMISALMRNFSVELVSLTSLTVPG